MLSHGVCMWHIGLRKFLNVIYASVALSEKIYRVSESKVLVYKNLKKDVHRNDSKNLKNS